MFKRSAGKRLRTDHTAASLMESLENRVMFGVGGTAFPTVDMLQNPNNTVVRIQTNYGDIDLEMFDSQAQATVDNFLRYVRAGHYDQTFFHRLAYNGNSPFVLQGGGFRFDDASGNPFSAVPQYDQIQNQFDPSRSNVARTIAMAKLAPPNQGGPPNGGPDSATNQWFINLGDNSANLDNQNGGFTVFGRVLGDASWSVVTTIQNLSRENLRQSPQFTGQYSGNFSDVPTTSNVPSHTNVTEDLLVRLNDVEIIKPRDVAAFYTVQVYYPEGFAGSTINEFLPMGNPGETVAHYQVIVRAERIDGDIATVGGWFRDRVIDTGSINAHSRGGITISQFGPQGAPGENDKVPQGVPYAIEVWSTAPIAANLSHYDFGTSTGEAFTPTTDLTWSFGEAAKLNGSVFDFLVWDNPNDTDATLTITFYFQNTSTTTLNVTTDAYRRGGLAFANVANNIIPDNSVFSIRIQSNVGVTAALSRFDNRESQTGSSSLGVPGAASSVGVIPFGQGGEGIDSMRISFFNPGTTASVVSIRLRFENPAENLQPGGGTLVIPGNRRVTLDLATLLNQRIVDGDVFSVYYTTGATSAVYAHSSIVALEDAVSNAFGVGAATGWLFAEGFMDPARAGDSVLETLSIFNPNSTNIASQNRTANITFTFFYGDGTTINHNIQVLPGARADLYLDEFDPILDQGRDHNRFYYSIRITSDVPIISQMLHYDLTLGGLQASGGFSTLGTPVGTVTPLSAL